MKNVFMLLFVMCFITNHSLSQKRDSLSVTKYNDIHFLYIIKLNNAKSIISENIVVSANQVKSLEMISRFECIRRFGVLTPSGAAIIKLNPYAKLLLLNRIFEKFHIDPNNISKILIDGMYVETPETIVIEESEIAGVKVLTNPGDKKNVLNIITSDRGRGDSTQAPKRNYLLMPQEVTAIENYFNIKK